MLKLRLSEPLISYVSKLLSYPIIKPRVLEFLSSMNLICLSEPVSIKKGTSEFTLALLAKSSVSAIKTFPASILPWNILDSSSVGNLTWST